jgi:hypothetical protein
MGDFQMPDHHLLALIAAIAVLSAVFGWAMCEMKNRFLDWLDDRREARTPEGRAEKAADEAWEAASEDTLTRMARQHAAEPLSRLPRAEGRAEAVARLAPEALDAEAAQDLPAFVPEPDYYSAPAGDEFTDGTGPQPAIGAEPPGRVSGVGAMTAIPQDRRGEFIMQEYRPDDNERGKWGFVPFRMGTPPHGMPVFNPGGNGGEWGHNYASRRAIGPPPAMAALEDDEARVAALLAKAEEAFGPPDPKADWDLLAAEASRHHELVDA